VPAASAAWSAPGDTRRIAATIHDRDGVAVGGVDVEIRQVDGSGWARAVGDGAGEAASWIMENALPVVGVIAAILVVWVVWRVLTRAGVSRY